MGAIGAFVLENIKENQAIEEIIDKISTTYDVNKEIIQSDVQAFLEELERINLIKHERK